MRTVFELKVIPRGEDACFLLLSWQQHRQALTACLPYPTTVLKRYQRWQQRYLKFYQLANSDRPQLSGRLDPGSGDLAHDLQVAEQAWLHAFNQWLSEGEGRSIQQRIQAEITQLFQTAAQSATRNEIAAGVNIGVDVYVACASSELEKLPWENWQLAPSRAALETVRIIRAGSNRLAQPLANARSRKPRILAILGHDSQLPVQQDWQILQSLSQNADLQQFTYGAAFSPAEIKQQLARLLSGPPGWDILFFAGHSDEAALSGGRFALTPDCQLSISELEADLQQARSQGLQLVIFNSCSGLSLAQALVKLGLQGVVMREPIRNDVAQQFLAPFCQALADRQTVADAVQTACQHLQMAERLALPSAHLLPLLYSPPQVPLYQLDRLSWPQQLRQWLPTRREAVTLGALIFLSLVVDIQEVVFDARTLVQAVYRQVTQQLPEPDPPVLLIEVDEESLKRYQEQHSFRVEVLENRDIDHVYLTQLLTTALRSQISAIGIQYNLLTNQPNDRLPQAVHQAIQHKRTWFVFTARTLDSLANPQWSLRGNPIVARGWQLERPESTDCQRCPFAYLLALAHRLQQAQLADSAVPQPQLNSRQPLQPRIAAYLAAVDDSADRFPRAQSTRLPVMIDLSLPPNRIYHQIPAWQLLSAEATPSQLQALDYEVMLIAAGPYWQNPDMQVAPLARAYWCQQGEVLLNLAAESAECHLQITHGQFNAYMAHHWLRSHHVTQIPDWWMICLVALMAKCAGRRWPMLLLPQRRRRHQLAAGLMLLGLASLQIYVSLALLVPWLFPSLTAGFYLKLLGQSAGRE
ncbi:MAG: CHAT domain-containing protein [Leptolyngbya sp. SIO4C1]|nr:CHAT domain-containing protein [Leptolyngbya sp. SIO4C1]